MLMMEITDESIDRIGDLLLPEGATFNDEKDERKTVIKQLNESVDVSACPGSGKTTTLLAKLLLLEERMPFKDGKGICVLTHTNVAIDELKLKVGQQVDHLYSYPNFFGTFQRFVNKFIGIPAYIYYFEKRPVSIDADIYKSVLIKKYQAKDQKNPFRNLFIARNYQRLSDGDLTFYELLELKYQKLKQLRIDFREGKVSDRILSDEAVFTPFSVNSNTGGFILDLKNEVFQEGNLHYDDIYNLAFRYLEEFGDRLKSSLSKRFKFVFIDEMQDTYSHQDKIINEIFDESVVIQKLGDPNQSIYNSVSVDNIWQPDEEALPISTSKRFGESIAKVLRSVCISPNEDLSANEEINSIEPHIIVYNEDTIGSMILERYIELIDELNVVERAGDEIRPIRAIGWVGPNPDKPEKHTIKSYFDLYNRTANINKPTLPTVKSHLRKYNSLKASKYFESILNCFSRILQIADVKRDTGSGTRSFTKNTLLATLKDQNENFYINFRTNISKWISGIISSTDSYSEEVLESVREYINEDFLPFFEIEGDEEELRNFIDGNFIAEGFDEEDLVDRNIFNHSSEDLAHIDVEVGTVHSAKGETHTATLYLETDYHSQRESDRIMDQLKGNAYDNPDSDDEIRIKETLKMAYVGMSRPTHLLCFAGKEENIMPNYDDLEDNGWVIIDDLINSEER